MLNLTKIKRKNSPKQMFGKYYRDLDTDILDYFCCPLIIYGGLAYEEFVNRVGLERFLGGPIGDFPKDKLGERTLRC